MIQLSADIEGSKELSRRLLKIPADIGNFKVPLFKVDREVRISIEANYGSRGALFGERWAPRKDSKPHPLLEKTGRMRRSFESDLGPDYVAITNSAEQFKFHQSAAPRKKLPRRVMMKLDELRKTFIVKTFQAHVKDALKGRS